MLTLTLVGLVALLVLVVLGGVVMVVDAARGCLISWFWIACGGLENSLKVIEILAVAIIEIVAKIQE